MKEITVPVLSRIEEIVRDVPGWSPVDQLYTLFNIAYLTSDLPGDIVEIGSWCGRSSAVLGLAARLSGASRVVCIDLFPARNDWRRNADGGYSLEVRIDGVRVEAFGEHTLWKEPFERDVAPLYARHDSILEIFEDTVRRNGLGEVVSPFKGTSSLWRQAASPGFRCRLAFVDGDHDYEAVRRDISNVDHFLVPGGWICFDDAFSSYEGVTRAIEECIVGNPAYELCRQMTRKCFVARKRGEGFR